MAVNFPAASNVALQKAYGSKLSVAAGQELSTLLWKTMSWGHGAVQRALLAELQKQQQAIDTMSLLRIICDGDEPTYSQGQSGRRALWHWSGTEPLLHSEARLEFRSGALHTQGITDNT